MAAIVLDKLNNIYKHRRLSVLAVRPGGRLEIGANKPGLAIIGMRPPGPLEDDAVLLECTTDGSKDMKVEVNYTFDVGFDEPDVLPWNLDVREVLVTMGNDVQAVINRLEADLV